MSTAALLISTMSDELIAAELLLSLAETDDLELV
jgi:hypothetical protein